MNGKTRERTIGGCVAAMLLICACSSCSWVTPHVKETTIRSETYKPRPFDQLDGFFNNGLIPGDTVKWQDNPSAPGEPEIVIDKKKQMGYFYRGDQLMGYFPVSTGKHSVSTPEGEFKVLLKNSEHHSCYGQFVSKETGKVMNDNADIRVHAVPEGQRFVPAEMPFFMRIKDTVGIHQGYLPGKPASHGCIRVPDLVAAKLFNATPVGTRVLIRGDLGKDFFVKRDAQKAAKALAAKQKAASLAADGQKTVTGAGGAANQEKGGADSPASASQTPPATVSANSSSSSQDVQVPAVSPAPSQDVPAPSLEEQKVQAPAESDKPVRVVVPVSASEADEPASSGTPQPLSAPAVSLPQAEP